MTQHISEDVVSPIREEVEAYLHETATIDIIAETEAPPVEIVATSTQAKSLDIAFTTGVSPELLSR
jgi:hypothetical protein